MTGIQGRRGVTSFVPIFRPRASLQAGEAPQKKPKAPGVMNSFRKMTDDVFFGRL